MSRVTFGRHFYLLLLSFVLVTLSGCGGGSSAVQPVAKFNFTSGASVSLVPAGNGSYTLRGDNLTNVASVDITVRYDTAAFSGPTVTQGDLLPATFTLPNTNNPGQIRIAELGVQGVTGSGVLATITFSTITGSGTFSFDNVTLLTPEGVVIQ